MLQQVELASGRSSSLFESKIFGCGRFTPNLEEIFKKKKKQREEFSNKGIIPLPFWFENRIKVIVAEESVDVTFKILS